MTPPRSGASAPARSTSTTRRQSNYRGTSGDPRRTDYQPRTDPQSDPRSRSAQQRSNPTRGTDARPARTDAPQTARGPKARGSEATRARQQLDRSDRRSAQAPARPSRTAKSPQRDLFARQQTVTADGRSFAELGVPAPLIAPLAGLGAVEPFPIQSATLPPTLAGQDVLGRGRTGSGKTIAFAIPLVARLAGRRSAAGKPRGLVLAPTRELALQIDRTVAPLAAALGLKTTVIFGGVGYGGQTSALRRGVDIVIGCPGRLEDLQHTGSLDLSAVEVTVLDEADHMADLGFLPGVRRLLGATPASGQRMLFSATLDNGISILVDDFLTDPQVFAVDDETSPVEELTHHVFAVSNEHRGDVIRELAGSGQRRLFFTRTKHTARKWAAQLSKSGIPAVDLHGNLSQNARERNLAAFADGTARVLVATDIAARGIHVDEIELVVHVDPPTEHKAYLHRSGRTARAGASGTVVTIMTPEQRGDVTKMMRQAGISPTTSTVIPGSPAISAITRG